MIAIILVAVLSLQRISELFLSKRNAIISFKEGAREFGANHYWMFVVLHTSWLLGILVEGCSSPFHSWYVVFITFAVLAQILRYWAIFSLGAMWNTRILVVPGKKLVRSGPYKFLPHPNYVAVCVELLIIPLIVQAYYTACIVSVLNLMLLLFVRIPAENKALREAG